jgi:CheY-like chemotaxis protein
MARFLIIEDNPDNRELMSYLLRAFGHEVLAAGDGEEGLALARREQVGLIVCDLDLPVMDGYEVCRRLKGDPALGRIPLVAVTAFAMAGDQDRALAAGFDQYIPKPIAPERFVAQLELLLNPGP